MIVTSRRIADTWLLWAPLSAAILHIVEEFVWPGGFMRWYKHYRGASVSSITPRFLMIINLILLAACWNAAVAAGTQPTTQFAIAYWIAISAILCSNGVWHLWAAAKSRTYSPGTITGLILYIPLSIYGFVYFLRSGFISIGGALVAVLIGSSYPWWSAAFHGRSRTAAA
ncbi:MAG: HXXEE domain-containing protein [Gemmatimonadota bacterium]|nr:HXXEE domain-containing protein [Gemmatimonadota bacterium]